MDFTRLFDIIPYQASKYPQEVAIACRPKNKEWQYYTTQHLQELIDTCCKGLLALGVEKGDKVAMISTVNCVEWNILDMAVMQIGAVNVPIYPTISEEDYRFIFEHAEIKYCFVNNENLYQKVVRLLEETPLLKAIYTFEKYNHLPHWKEIYVLGEKNSPINIEATKAGVSEQDLATIIYTSGTTGTPKGVMLSHNNIVSNIKSMLPIIPVEHTNRVVSFLPLCHIFERTTAYLYMAVGASIYYAQNLGTILDDFQFIKPHYFTSVPRILERVYEGAQRKGLKLKGYRRKVYDWAFDLGEAYKLDVHYDWMYRMKLRLARRLVFNQLVSTFGGELRGIVSGAAALQPKLARLFAAAGIPVREGYGLTESSPVLSFNRFTPGETRLGTVGIPLPGIEIEIAADQEILARGPNIMMGYYKRPDLTKEVIDEEGWLHTGDVGEFVEGRFLKITDRKKELFKTSGGKYVAPQAIENRLLASPFIEQVIVVGNARKYAAALIVPAFAYLKAYFKGENVILGKRPEMVENELVLKQYKQIIEACNASLGKTESIKRFKLLTSPFTLEKEELTPTLKLKRRVITKNYADEIEEVYKRS